MKRTKKALAVVLSLSMLASITPQIVLANSNIPDRYTVTYTDGVEGQEIFKDEVYSDLKIGDVTPKFKGSLERKGCRQIEGYLLAQQRSWFDLMMDCLTSDGVIKRLDLAINDRVGVLDIPKLIEKYQRGECISYFRRQKRYDGTDKNGDDIPESTGNTMYIGSTQSELYFCIYEKAKEQYVKKGIAIEDSEIKNRFEIRMKNERAYKAVVDLLTYYDAERTAFSIINHYIRFVDPEEDKPKNRWKINPEWAYFVGDNREPIRLTTQPEPFTMERALHWLQRQVAPTLKMVQELDKMNHTTIMDDMLEHTELKDKHRHLLELEKTTIEERIDTAVSKETDGIF